MTVVNTDRTVSCSHHGQTDGQVTFSFIKVCGLSYMVQNILLQYLVQKKSTYIALHIKILNIPLYMYT